jgi:RNA polymerase sigma factor (TIGR02999 family)
MRVWRFVGQSDSSANAAPNSALDTSSSRIPDVTSPRMAGSTGDVTQFLADLQDGRLEAGSRLIELVYDELHRLARHQMRHERPDHTLQATALLHEAYLRLVNQPDRSWQNRAHFIGVAAQVMRRILIDYARSQQTAKRGSGLQKVSLEEPLLFSEAQSEELVVLNEALERLAQFDERMSRIVELRFFGGLTVDETAEVLAVSSKTVKRDWSVARAWLHRELSQGGDDDA